MLILPDDGSGGSTSAATGKLRYVTAPGENWEEILLRNILGNTTEKSCGEIVLQMQRADKHGGRAEKREQANL